MTYPYSPYWQYPNYLNALQQNYNNQLQQQATQHPIRVILVSNEEEAKATPAESNGNPILFYNKSQNRVYLKQINPQTGAAPLQIYKAEATSLPVDEFKNEIDINTYKKDFNTIIEGINGLYRILNQKQNITTQPPILIDEPDEVKQKRSNK